MSIESLLKIDKNGSVPGTSKALQDRLYDQIFGEHGKNIMLDVSNPSYKALMFYHYQKLGAKPELGLPRQFGHEIFKKLQKKISKSGGAFLNGKGEKMDKDKASRSKYCDIDQTVNLSYDGYLTEDFSLPHPSIYIRRGHEERLPPYEHTQGLEELSIRGRRWNGN